jgi:hypothetical protein
MILDEQEKIDIRRSKFIILINLLISLFCVYLLAADLYAYITVFPGYFWVIFKVFFLLIIGNGAIHNIKRLFSNTPFLSVQTEGIDTEQYGFIDWENIDNAIIEDVKKVYIFVKNPDDYLEQSKGLRKILMTVSMKEKGTPIMIKLLTGMKINQTFFDSEIAKYLKK